MSDRPESQPADEPPSLAPGEREPSRDQRPVMPTMPERPGLAAPPPRRGGNGPFLLLLAGVGFLLALLFVCSGANIGVVLLTAGVFAFGAVHYVVWGWWLSRSINRRVDEQDESSP